VALDQSALLEVIDTEAAGTLILQGLGFGSPSCWVVLHRHRLT
jgi:hypothetical protein